ncbi:MAG: CBS domain-containing protein [Rhodocyclales bacterium]|nr:CBS domain-containing protein [Rhodocyclales bacterium]
MDTNSKLISAVMTSKVWQVGADDTAEATLALMQHRKVSSVLVTDGDRILGIITEHDIVRALHEGGNIKQRTCADLMQAPVITVTDTTLCIDAYHLMVGRGIRHLAVTDAAGHIVGVASEGDLMRDFGIEYFMTFKDIGSVMSRRICRLPPNATVADAVAQMLAERQSCVVVVDAQGGPAGMLTERDIVRLCNQQENPERLTLAETMCAPVRTVRPHGLLHEAVGLMAAAHIRRLVAVDDGGAVCGLLTHHDIVLGLEGGYVSYLKEIVEKQAHELKQAALIIDEKLLLTNILRSATGTALLAADLSYRISYATPAVADVLGVRTEDIGGQDLRGILKLLGWAAVDGALSEAALADGATQHTVATPDGGIDLQASLLLDAQDKVQGYLVLAQRA